MSNFVVSDLHIQSLVHFFTQNCNGSLRGKMFISLSGGHYNLETEKGHLQICRDVVQGNIESQAHRYPNDLKESAFSVISREKHAKELTPVEAIKLATCLKYNSCEGLMYSSQSVAAKEAKEYTHKFCLLMQSVAHAKLAGYDAAPWEI